MRAKGLISVAQLKERDIVKVPLRALTGKPEHGQEMVRALVLPPFGGADAYDEGHDINLCPLLTRDQAAQYYPNISGIKVTDNQGAGLPGNEEFVIIPSSSGVASRRHVLGVSTDNTVIHDGGFEITHPDWQVIENLFEAAEERQRRAPGGLAQVDLSNISGTTNVTGGLGRNEERDIRGEQVNLGARGPRRQKNRLPYAAPDLTKDEFFKAFNPSEGIKHLFNHLAQELGKPDLLLSEAIDYAEKNQAAVTNILAGLARPEIRREPTIEEILQGNMLEALDASMRTSGEKLAVKRIRGFLEKFIEDKKSGREGPYNEISTISDFLTANQKFNADNGTSQPVADWLFRFRGVGMANYQQLAEDLTLLTGKLPAIVTPGAPAITAAQALADLKALRGTFMEEALALDNKRGHGNLSYEDLQDKYSNVVDGQRNFFHKKMFTPT
ncbi:MAG: hypothetical protein EBQ96_06155 [Proteobacteria bacterium]|nr:hypothetical protein [Pseudomonadota bacterium]